MKKPYAIIIMDGYGINPDKKGNAIELEGSPNVKRYEREYPSSQLGASGMSVGLPEGQMGNSEVGHLNMGRGAHRVPGAYQNHQRDSGWGVLQERGAARRYGKR